MILHPSFLYIMLLPSADTNRVIFLVGVTGSGQTMRKDPTRTRHVYQQSEDDGYQIVLLILPGPHCDDPTRADGYVIFFFTHLFHLMIPSLFESFSYLFSSLTESWRCTDRHICLHNLETRSSLRIHFSSEIGLFYFCITTMKSLSIQKADFGY